MSLSKLRRTQGVHWRQCVLACTVCAEVIQPELFVKRLVLGAIRQRSPEVNTACIWLRYSRASELKDTSSRVGGYVCTVCR